MNAIPASFLEADSKLLNPKPFCILHLVNLWSATTLLFRYFVPADAYCFETSIVISSIRFFIRTALIYIDGHRTAILMVQVHPLTLYLDISFIHFPGASYWFLSLSECSLHKWSKFKNLIIFINATEPNIL